MRIVSGILWLVVAVVAALLGLLLITDEPGATAGRWYLGFAVVSALVGCCASSGAADELRRCLRWPPSPWSP